MHENQQNKQYRRDVTFLGLQMQHAAVRSVNAYNLQVKQSVYLKSHLDSELTCQF